MWPCIIIITSLWPSAQPVRLLLLVLWRKEHVKISSFRKVHRKDCNLFYRCSLLLPTPMGTVHSVGGVVPKAAPPPLFPRSSRNMANVTADA